MAKGRQIKKMLGGALNAVCPPGFWCMDTGFLLFVLVVLVTLFAGVYYHHKMGASIPVDLKSLAKPTVIESSTNEHSSNERSGNERRVEQQLNVPMIEMRDTQHEYNKQRPSPPERYYGAPVDTRGFIPPPGVPVIPIQIPTQGLPEQFQQVGVLAAPGGTATSATPNRTLLPLFGRKVAVARDRYNYYTRSDGINPIQVPVSYKNRNCEDDNGCDEIFSGETISVPLLGQTFVATTYRYNLPRYIPYVS